MAKREIFTAGMATLGSSFNRAIDRHLLDGYWLALEALSDDDLNRAFARALRESKFMPVPMELLTYAGKARNLTAECATAWEAVRGAIRLHDYTVATIDFGPLVNTVLRCMGSWEWLCEQGADDMVWRAKDFERFYLAFAEGDERALRPAPVVGWGLGRVGCDDVRVAIGGVLPPLELPAAPNPVSDVVRELADAKSHAGAAGTGVVGSKPTEAKPHSSEGRAPATALPLRETKPKAPPMTPAEVDARKAEIAAQFAARGVTA